MSASASDPAPACAFASRSFSAVSRPVVSSRSATSSVAALGAMPAPRGGSPCSAGASPSASADLRCGWSSNSTCCTYRQRPASGGALVEGAEISSEKRLACEECDQRAEREERAEGDRHLPSRGAVAREEEEADEHGREHAEHEADRDRLAERGAEEEGELHVPHPHALRVREQS